MKFKKKHQDKYFTIFPDTTFTSNKNYYLELLNIFRDNLNLGYFSAK